MFVGRPSTTPSVPLLLVTSLAVSLFFELKAETEHVKMVKVLSGALTAHMNQLQVETSLGLMASDLKLSFLTYIRHHCRRSLCNVRRQAQHYSECAVVACDIACSEFILRVEGRD